MQQQHLCNTNHQVVEDNTAPEFIYVPANADVECSDEWPLEAVIVEDACGPVTLTETIDTLPGTCRNLKFWFVIHRNRRCRDASNIKHIQ